MDLIVGFTGLKRSGKDTAAGFLSELGFKKFSFADPVRQAVELLDPLVPLGGGAVGRLSDALSYSSWEELKDTDSLTEVRKLLQRMGTEVGRNIFGDVIWINLLNAAVEKDKTPLVVITDVRFANEADYIINRGGIVIKIEREGTAPGDPHPSEKLDLQYTHLIKNNSTVENLGKRVINVVSPLLHAAR